MVYDTLYAFLQLASSSVYAGDLQSTNSAWRLFVWPTSAVKQTAALFGASTPETHANHNGAPFPTHQAFAMDAASPAHRVGGRLALSDPAVKKIAQASSSHNYFDELPKLQGEDDWHKWSDALQDAALMAGADAILNGESTHPLSLDDKQCTTAEWNDNIKRTAVWRRRNESLLKAMRDTMESDADIDMFGSLNAHKAYIGLKSRYYVSDNQKVINLYNDELMLAEIDLDDSPKETADDFQAAFDHYNHLFDHNESQRLPEIFLKLEFLNSLGIVYADWVRTLLKEHDVLGLDQGPTLTFNELVDLVIIERDRLLQAQRDTRARASASHQPHQSEKRNISEVEEDSHPETRDFCSVPHHAKYMRPHTNQQCILQNPRLRPKDWAPRSKDRDYLANSPQLECENDPKNENQAGAQASSVGDGTSQENSNDGATFGEYLARSRFAEVQAQKDSIANVFGGGIIKNKRLKFAPTLMLLSGKWLLYAPNTAGHHHIRFWNTTTDKQKQSHPGVQQYQGQLTVESREGPETYQIISFTPPSKVTGRPVEMRFRRQHGASYQGTAVFWGNGKMFFMAPGPCTNGSTGSPSFVRFAGLQSEDTTNISGDDSSDEEYADGGGDGGLAAEDDERRDLESSGREQEDNDYVDPQGENAEASETSLEKANVAYSADDQEWAHLADAKLAEVEAQKNAVSEILEAHPRSIRSMGRGPFPGLWQLYASSFNPGEDGYHHLMFWEIRKPPGNGLRRYRGELCTGPSKNVAVHQIKQFSLPRIIRGSIVKLFTITGNSPIGNMTLWGEGEMYIDIHSSHVREYNEGMAWVKFAGIWKETGEHLPWKGLQKLVETKRFKHVATSSKNTHQSAGEERYDLVVRAEKNTVLAVKTEDEDTNMAEDEEEDETSIIIKTEDADSSSDDSHDEWTDDVATTDRAVRTQEHAVRQGLVSPLHTLSGKWYFHSPDHNPGLDKDISITFYDRQVHDISERMCAPGHCRSTPAQIHYCGELRFKAPNGEHDFHCFIKQFDVPKQISLVPVMIELWELHNKRAIFINTWFLGAGTMRMAIPTTCIPSYQGKKTMITFSGVKYGWARPAG